MRRWEDHFTGGACGLIRVNILETFLAVSRREDFCFIAASQGAKRKQKSGLDKVPAERVIKDIRRATRRLFSAEE